MQIDPVASSSAALESPADAPKAAAKSKADFGPATVVSISKAALQSPESTPEANAAVAQDAAQRSPAAQAYQASALL